MVKILGIEGADRRTAGRFYGAVVQAVLLFVSEMWVVTTWMEKALAGFRHRVVRRIAGMDPKRQRYRAWVYTHIGAELLTVVLDEIWIYIARLQNTFEQ